MPAQLAAASTADPDATLPNVAAIAPAPATAVHASPPPPATPPRASQAPAIAVVAAIAVIGIAALAATWWLWPRTGATTTAATPSAPPIQAAAAPATPTVEKPATSATLASTPALPPGNLVISAVGLADPSDPRYASDPSLLPAAARADAKRQLVEKALVLLLDRQSLSTNYDMLQSRVLAKSGDFIDNVVRESSPQLGKDGLMTVTTQGVVNVKAVQQSLNRLSRDERVELIRANGDPRIAVRIATRDADAPDAPPMPSAIAENVIKERIKSFGFRTWADDAAGADSADFIVTGEATVKRLSTRLAASGLVITKYALSSWTIKCANRVTGEEICFNTTLPKGMGSFASEEEALRAIGTQVADQLNRDLFLSHVNVKGRKVTLVVTGMPDRAWEELFAAELPGLPGVIAAHAGPPGTPRLYDVEVASASAPSDAIAADVVAPVNDKLGRTCFAVGAVEGTRVSVAFDAQCADPALRTRLETNPPAGLYRAPEGRRKAIIKNPETLRKLV
jgi:eukaryotic-like serine/threonine-protein kinase